MNNIFTKIISFIFARSTKSEPKYNPIWQSEWSLFLEKTVSFYENLNQDDRALFERRVLLFIHSTRIEEGQGVEVTDEDRLLVAASAIIPVWGFPDWHYFNLDAVYLMSAAFDEEFVCGTSRSRFTGMVGTGPMSGKMALSKPHLHQGFLNSRDKRNVGIHEFVHLIDMADGQLDGFPERFKEYAYTLVWFDFVRHKINEITENKSNINNYAATNNAEFFSVVSEYFFERPAMLKQKHPELCSALEQFYKQNVELIMNDNQFSKNALCPCGSNKKYKRCCLVVP